MTAPATLLEAHARARRADPGRPSVTYYDDSTGERVELSVATVDNWVSKIANLCSMELALEPGDLVSVELPTHWQALVSVLGAWAAGLAVHTDSAADVRLRIVGPSGLATYRDDARADHVLACSLRPLGGRFVEPIPTGWLDFAVEVPPQPDALMTGAPTGPPDPALVTSEGQLDHAELLQRGLVTAAELDLQPGGRLVTDLDWADPSTLVTTVAAPLAVAASVVLVAPTTPERRTAIAAQERATVELWRG